MIIGTPRETKNHEYRVGLTPAGAHVLVEAGHAVLVERAAGSRAGFSDGEYQRVGARIVDSPAALWGQAELVVKVKEPQPAEYSLIRPGQILFCYLHLAAEVELLQRLVDSGASCVAYETVTDAHGELALLAPMSRIAGRLAPQMGAWALQMANGGSGVLLGGVPGVPPARVVVVGAGQVGANAAQIAVGMGADVTLLDRTPVKLEALDRIYRGRLKTCVADPLILAEHVATADLVIGAVLVPARRAPRLITAAMLARMRPGSVLVDVSIDQGGVAETSRPTSHSAPLYLAEGVVHYCVTNMPAAVARTATLALTQVTLPCVSALAAFGLRGALERDSGLMQGLQVHAGHVTCAALAEDMGRPWIAPAQALENAGAP
ncbi:MAG: alanine dehydrogenase [Betaproteobacteria bacterium]|nr:alanine dehydrogenase [Betaproteobacteria bacterium]